MIDYNDLMEATEHGEHPYIAKIMDRMHEDELRAFLQKIDTLNTLGEYILAAKHPELMNYYRDTGRKHGEVRK